MNFCLRLKLVVLVFSITSIATFDVALAQRGAKSTGARPLPKAGETRVPTAESSKFTPRGTQQSLDAAQRRTNSNVEEAARRAAESNSNRTYMGEKPAVEKISETVTEPARVESQLERATNSKGTAELTMSAEAKSLFGNIQASFMELVSVAGTRSAEFIKFMGELIRTEVRLWAMEGAPEAVNFKNDMQLAKELVAEAKKSGRELTVREALMQVKKSQGKDREMELCARNMGFAF